MPPVAERPGRTTKRSPGGHLSAPGPKMAGLFEGGVGALRHGRSPMIGCPGPCAPPSTRGATARGTCVRGNPSPRRTGDVSDGTSTCSLPSGRGVAEPQPRPYHVKARATCAGLHAAQEASRGQLPPTGCRARPSTKWRRQGAANIWSHAHSSTLACGCWRQRRPIGRPMRWQEYLYVAGQSPLARADAL